MTIHSPVVAFWALILVNIIWGAGFAVIDVAIENMPVYTFNAFRFSLATLALLPLWWMSTRANDNKKVNQAPYSTSQLFKTGFGLGLLLFLGFSLQAKALLYTSVSNTGFITGLCVPLVPIIGFLLYKNKVGKEVWISAITATIGLYFLTMTEHVTFNLGDILVAISALCYAAHICLIDKHGCKFAVIPLSVIQLFAVACYSSMAAIIDVYTGGADNYPPLLVQLSNINVLAAIAYSAILASAFAYWVQTASQRLIEPHKIALIFALEPIFAHITAYLLLDEQLGLTGWLGAGLIITGMLYAELGGKRKAKMQPLDQMASPAEQDQELPMINPTQPTIVRPP